MIETCSRISPTGGLAGADQEVLATGAALLGAEVAGTDDGALITAGAAGGDVGPGVAAAPTLGAAEPGDATPGTGPDDEAPGDEAPGDAALGEAAPGAEALGDAAPGAADPAELVAAEPRTGRGAGEVTVAAGCAAGLTTPTRGPITMTIRRPSIIAFCSIMAMSWESRMTESSMA